MGPGNIGTGQINASQRILDLFGSSNVERFILVLGVLLRLYLAVVNAEANDDHLAVIKIIARRHRLPRLHEAWEGFQPKLYHTVVALLWNLNPWQYSVVEIRIAQLVSCTAGIVTLFVVQRALREWDISPSIRLLAFALAALNPTLIGINAQATNDSFVILFGSLTLFAGAEFFRNGSRRAFLVMTASVVLAVLSKGNGLVIFIAVVVALMLRIIGRKMIPGLSHRQLAGVTSAFVVIVLSCAFSLGSYRSNWEDTGNPFAINGNPAPRPHLFERTYVYRPGTTSIADTYFTFRLVDMLKQPFITNDPVDYPLHRTSLWSQLYGRAHFGHFAQHPPSWKSTNDSLLNLGRLILLCALLPTIYLVCGMIRSVRALLMKEQGSSSSREAWLEENLYLLVGAGFVGFIILYSFTYRDFSTMKAEFLFPALIAFLFFFVHELQRADSRWAQWPLLRESGRWVLAALPLLYVLDIVVLSIQLTHR